MRPFCCKLRIVVIYWKYQKEGGIIMKKIVCLILAVLLCLSCFCGCQTAQPEAPETPTQPSTTTGPDRGELSVLFVGNSYTY